MAVHKDNLIVALDFPDFESAKDMVERVGDHVDFYKIGLEMMASGDYFKMIDYLKNNNKRIFADLKLYDIPKTIARTVQNLAQYDVDLLTIHAASKEIMLQAAQNKGNINLLAVTVLTCLDQGDLNDMGFDGNLSLQDQVLKKAKLAIDCGIDGVVASANEAKHLRSNITDQFLIVTPGIRIAKTEDDQKRTQTPQAAIAAGASHLVVGRPITRSSDPAQSAQDFLKM